MGHEYLKGYMKPLAVHGAGGTPRQAQVHPRGQLLAPGALLPAPAVFSILTRA